MPFVKGKSGNPEGRPKGTGTKTELIRKALSETFDDGEKGRFSLYVLVSEL